jgi:putative hydrolase of the HAD superfamily
VASAVKAVIFDFFGTIACGPEGAVSGYGTVFARHGYRLDPDVEARHFGRFDGVEHAEHSLDKATYESWSRSRKAGLAAESGVAPQDVDVIVEDLRSLDLGPMVAYPDAAETLAALRERGFLIGVCSNWGWELDTSIAEAGLSLLVDGAVTSARAGARKPHPRIFGAITEAIGVRPSEAVFVGDSLWPDVVGPMRFGMAAAHIWRGDRPGEAPDLPVGARRISSLSELLEWPFLERAEPIASASEAAS